MVNTVKNRRFLIGSARNDNLHIDFTCESGSDINVFLGFTVVHFLVVDCIMIKFIRLVLSLTLHWPGAELNKYDIIYSLKLVKC